MNVHSIEWELMGQGRKILTLTGEYRAGRLG